MGVIEAQGSGRPGRSNSKRRAWLRRMIVITRHTRATANRVYTPECPDDTEEPHQQPERRAPNLRQRTCPPSSVGRPLTVHASRLKKRRSVCLAMIAVSPSFQFKLLETNQHADSLGAYKSRLWRKTRIRLSMSLSFPTYCNLLGHAAFGGSGGLPFVIIASCPSIFGWS